MTTIGSSGFPQNSRESIQLAIYNLKGSAIILIQDSPSLRRMSDTLLVLIPAALHFQQVTADDLRVARRTTPIVGGLPSRRLEKMKWRLFKSILACTLLLSANTALAESETIFCRALRADRAAKQAWPIQSETIWYRGLDGKIADLGSSLPKRGVNQLFYYVRDDDRPPSQPSILNVKLIYRVPPKQSQRKYVDLSNNKWAGFSVDKLNKVKSICGRVAPQEYELFHLQNTRSYCLQYFFHQTADDEFKTIAFPGQRESFAFQDMLGETPGGNVGDFLANLFGPAKARAAGVNSKTGDADLSTAVTSDVRSWIKNYTYGDALGRCVAIEPNIPESAQSLLLRVTNHRNYELRTRTWTLDISQ